MQTAVKYGLSMCDLSRGLKMSATQADIMARRTGCPSCPVDSLALLLRSLYIKLRVRILVATDDANHSKRYTSGVFTACRCLNNVSKDIIAVIFSVKHSLRRVHSSCTGWPTR